MRSLLVLFASFFLLCGCSTQQQESEPQVEAPQTPHGFTYRSATMEIPPSEQDEEVTPPASHKGFYLRYRYYYRYRSSQSFPLPGFPFWEEEEED